MPWCLTLKIFRWWLCVFEFDVMFLKELTQESVLVKDLPVSLNFNWLELIFICVCGHLFFLCQCVSVCPLYDVQKAGSKLGTLSLSVLCVTWSFQITLSKLCVCVACHFACDTSENFKILCGCLFVGNKTKCFVCAVHRFFTPMTSLTALCLSYQHIRQVSFVISN